MKGDAVGELEIGVKRVDVGVGRRADVGEGALGNDATTFLGTLFARSPTRTVTAMMLLTFT